MLILPCVLRVPKFATTPARSFHPPASFSQRARSGFTLPAPVLTKMPKTLGFQEGPLVWIDCEMTGLIPRKDKIIEIAVIITDGNLQLVDEGIELVVNVEKSLLDGMDEWCTNQHGSSGLTAACLASPITIEAAQKTVLEYIQKWIPNHRAGVLAGNSVHADRSFLVEEMPQVVEHLHYRLVDVSTIKELTRRWHPSKQVPASVYAQNTSAHRARADILGSIRELKYYRENLFIPPSPPPSPRWPASTPPTGRRNLQGECVL